LWEQVSQSSPNRYLREMAQREMDRIRRAVEENRRDLAVRRLGVPQVLVK